MAIGRLAAGIHQASQASTPKLLQLNQDISFMRMVSRSPRIALICIFSWTLIAAADPWPQFRGPHGSGVSQEADLPARWSEKHGLAWHVDVPGRANSSPAVTTDRIHITTQTKDHGLRLLSYQRDTGQLDRKTRLGQGQLVVTGASSLYEHRHNAATPTVAADDHFVYVFFGTGLLTCVRADTHAVVWQRDLVKHYGQYDITFGMASSPRLWNDRLFILCLTKGPSYVATFDTRTGREIWKVDRRLPAEYDGPDGYSTPTLTRARGDWELLVCGSDHANAYDPLSGRQLWISDGLKIDSHYGRVLAAPVSSGRYVVATSANPPGGGLGHMLGLKIQTNGDVTKVWKHTESTPDSSTPVIIGKHVFALADNGILTCLDLESGSPRWRKRLQQGTYHASLVAGDGKLYALSIEGTCTVLKSDGSETVISENHLPGTFYATPAISDGRVYLRAYEKLFAIQGSK